MLNSWFRLILEDLLVAIDTNTKLSPKLQFKDLSGRVERRVVRVWVISRISSTLVLDI